MNDLFNDLAILRRRRPLVHCITNQVTMHLVANALLALGASPIMSSSLDEAAEVAAQANALYLNTGTLSATSLEVMLAAGRVASRMGLPVVLDPVGAGFTNLRSQACAILLDNIKIKVIRANASEIMAIAGLGPGAKGVDARHSVEEARAAADLVADKYNLIVALTGKSDYVSDGGRNEIINGGHELMAMVSGMGCAVSGLLAAWLSLNSAFMSSTVHTLQLAGYCGVKAAAQVRGPGNFMAAWLDELYLTGYSC